MNNLAAEGIVDGHQTLRACRGIYVLILEAKLGSGQNMGTQTDPETGSHCCGAKPPGAPAT